MYKSIDNYTEVLKMLRFGVKELIQDIKFEKNNIKIEAEKWIDKIEENGIRNIDAGQVVFNKISDLEEKLENIEKNKTNIFSPPNILLATVTVATGLNTYHLFT